MKKGKIIISAAAIIVAASIVFNFDYFKSLLNAITEKASEVATSTENNIDSSEFEKTLDGISVDKFFTGNTLLERADSSKSCTDSQLKNAIDKAGLSESEFHKYRVMDGKTLSDPEIVKKMRAVRDSIPELSTDTLLRKTITISQVEDYIGDYGYQSIGGFLCRQGDIEGVLSYSDVIETQRLDYLDESGNRVYPDGGTEYAYIVFTTEDVDRIEIPYCNNFDGKCEQPFPCTGNGFTAARNGIVVPEYYCPSNTYVSPNIGAELHVVKGFTDTIIAFFDGEHFVEKKE